MREANALLRILLRSWLLVVGLLAGCEMGGGYSVYGPPPIAHDPTVEIVDFTYTPQVPVHAGDTLTFTATLNHYTDAGVVYADIGNPLVVDAMLNDDGIAPDLHARDGFYCGRLVWPASIGAAQPLPVVCHLEWQDYAPHLERSAPSLAIGD